jgi:outer membrane lipoprotein SlyB
MKKLKIKFLKLFLLITLAGIFTAKAQENISISELLSGDSVRIQSTMGSFYYGFYVSHNDSILTYTQLANLNETKNLKLKQIAEIILLSRTVAIPTATEPISETAPSKTTRQDITETPTAKETYTQDYGTRLPKSQRTTVQIVAGAGAGYLGALLGGVAGAFIGEAVSTYSYSYEPLIVGAFIGAISGSIISNAVVVYNLGNTESIKGGFWPTLGGTTLGMVAGVILWPISPVVAAVGGTLAFNKSRKSVKPYEGYKPSN